MTYSQLFSAALLVATVNGQQSASGKCGGSTWTGQKICVSGYTCSTLNQYYSQCIPSTSTSSSTGSSTSILSSASGLRWVGVDKSGAEFCSGAYPGIYGKDFIFPSLTSLDAIASFVCYSQAYIANYSAVINHTTGKGGCAIVDPHNFGRYNSAIITDTNAFQIFWENVAGAFKSNANAIFDTNNEYHDMDQTLVLNLNQAAINGIRAAGTTSQYIFGAWTWATVNDNLKDLTDPQNKIIYEMHQYLDSDGSGTSATCVSSTIGADRVSSATTWLRTNNKIEIIGEFAGGANSVCMSAFKGLLDHLKTNSDVWTGALWWGSGLWWGIYIYAFEPPSSTGYNYFDSTLNSYAP